MFLTRFSKKEFKVKANTPIGIIEMTFEFDANADEYLVKRRAQEVVAYQNDQKILATYDVEILEIS